MSSADVKTGESSDSAKKPNEVSASLALWAENNDIPAEDLALAYQLPLTTVPNNVGQKPGVEGLDGLQSANTEVGKYVAMDCEMVGVGSRENERSALARVSIVNFHGNTVLDCFVAPKEKVTDWRTWVSGVKASDMKNAITFEEAQQKVADILQDRILVGHAIKNDLDVLLLSHPRRDIRDTSRHPEFRKLSNGKTPGLKKLAKELLGVDIQGGSHSSIEDARACILLYRRHKQSFENHNLRNFPATNKKNHGKNGKNGKSGGKKKKKI